MPSTEPTGIEDNLAGGLLVGGVVVMMTGAAIPFLAPSLREAPWEGDLAAIAGNPTAHVWANGLLIAAAILTTLGLVALSIRFEGRSRPWAWMGLVAFAFAAVLGVIDRIIVTGPATWAAQQGLDETDLIVQAFSRLVDGLGVTFMILGFFALSLYGIAMSQIEGSSGIGWAFVAGGILGIVLELVGGTIPAFVFFGTAALGIATWRLGVTAPTRRRAAGQEK
jgi:hypothetical protein